MTSKKLSVTPSGVSFALGDASVSDYNRPCLRYTLVQRHTYAKSEIPAIYSALGELDEHRFRHHLEAFGLTDVDPQSSFNFEFKDILIKGKMDFPGTYKGKRAILEKKSTISTSTRSKMRKGIPTTDHVAQLVMYMGVEKAEIGFLVQSFYEFDHIANSLICTEEVKYTITIGDHGRIFVNGKVFEYTTKDLRSWLEHANTVLTTKSVASRPLQRKVCGGCPLRVQCDSIDSNQLFIEEFISEGAASIVNHIQSRDPQIFKPKRAKKQLRYSYKKGD